MMISNLHECTEFTNPSSIEHWGRAKSCAIFALLWTCHVSWPKLAYTKSGKYPFFWGGGEGRRHNFVIDCCVTIKITVDIVTKLS